MRTTIIPIVLGVLASLPSVPGHANTQFAGESITGVNTYGNGAITIFVSTPISEPGCNANSTRIDVQASDPNIKQILAIAMSAFASGAPISGSVNGCDPDNGSPTFDQSYNSWLTMNPP